MSGPAARTLRRLPGCFRGGERATVAIGIDVRHDRLPCLIEARYAAESDKAVPADSAPVERNGTQVALFLRPGEYRITARDAAGREFERRAAGRSRGREPARASC